jgi:hypothetical protein
MRRDDDCEWKMGYLRRGALIGAAVSVVACVGGAIAAAIWPHARPWLIGVSAAGAVGFIVAAFSRRYPYSKFSFRAAEHAKPAPPPDSPPFDRLHDLRSAGNIEAIKQLLDDLLEHDGHGVIAPEPVGYDESVRRAFTELVEPGGLMFNPPDHMQLRHTERVEVRLTRTLELTAELLEHLGGRGEPRLEEILTAPRMAVTLKGGGFQIEALSNDEEQSVLKDEITTWEFDIRAVKKGQQLLVMSVSLRIPMPGHLERKSVPVREAVIDVQVGVPALAWNFVSDYWQWFIGTGIAAAAVVVAVLYH